MQTEEEERDRRNRWWRWIDPRFWWNRRNGEYGLMRTWAGTCLTNIVYFLRNIQKLAVFGLFCCEEEPRAGYILACIRDFLSESLTECKNALILTIESCNPIRRINLRGVLRSDDPSFLLVCRDKTGFNRRNLLLMLSQRRPASNTMSVFNNDIALFYLDYDGRSTYTGKNLYRLHGIYWMMQISARRSGKGKLKMMDVRKSWSRKIPSHLFTARIIRTLKITQLDKPIRFYSARKLLTLFARTERNATTWRCNSPLGCRKTCTALFHVYKTVEMHR